MWPERQRLQERLQLALLERIVSEWIFVCVRLKEKIERVDHRHIDRKTDFNREMPGLAWKHEPGEEISMRVLLPVDEMIHRLHTQRVTRHWRAAVGRRPQTDDLRRECDEAIVVVDGLVMK